MQAGREIKFQAWDQDAKQMWTWEDILIGETAGIISFIAMLQQDQFIKRQFTGLHDKNGKEVYEGDVVRVLPWLVENQDAFTATIVWETGSFVLDKKMGGWIGYPIAILPSTATAYELEVIGNIYENPELLQVG